jgi:diacylglycerol kinase (ATP)
MVRHIIYIINPVSGTRGKQDLQALIEQTTTGSGIPFLVFPSVASGDYSFLFPFIDKHKTSDVVIAGGDGTVNQVVHALKTKVSNFGIIPCGSGNGLAFTAKIPKHPAKALEIIFKNKPQPVDGFYINGRYACMLCGLGFDAKVAHDFAKQPKRGLMTYVKQVIKNYFSSKPYHFKIEIPGDSFSTDAYFISIANSNQFGNNFTIAPRASLSDGMLDIVIATNQIKINLLLQTLRQVVGRNALQTGKTIFNKKGVIYFQADKVTILNPAGAPLHVDGDPAETAGRFEIAIEKNSFRLLQP